eukprot:7859918-Alexandrium_andersonii.AAC.1
MSASLVGSEMCIRDSARAVLLRRHRCEAPPAVLRVFPVSARAMLLTRHRPVSYTHLTLPTICSV